MINSAVEKVKKLQRPIRQADNAIVDELVNRVSEMTEDKKTVDCRNNAAIHHISLQNTKRRAY